MTKTVLVVEDNPDARELLTIVLAAEGFSVITAADGQVALNLVRERRPDLIITDVQMPNLEGFRSSVSCERSLRSRFRLW